MILEIEVKVNPKIPDSDNSNSRSKTLKSFILKFNEACENYNKINKEKDKKKK